MKTKTSILSFIAALFSIIAFGQDSTGTKHKTIHAQVDNNRVSVTHAAVKHKKNKKHYHTRRRTTTYHRTPARSRTTKITTTTTHSNK